MKTILKNMNHYQIKKFLFFEKITKKEIDFYQEENNLFFIDFWIVNYFGITTIFYFPI